MKEAFEKAGTKDPDVVMDVMHNTSFQNVCISPMGPLGPYGSNMGAKGAIVQFLPGSCELDPSFGLHPVLVRTYETPDKTMVEILEEMKGMERLLSGKKYGMAK